MRRLMLFPDGTIMDTADYEEYIVEDDVAEGIDNKEDLERWGLKVKTIREGRVVWLTGDEAD